MSVSAEATPVSYAGNGSTVTGYVVPWKFWTTDDLAVYVDGVAYTNFTVTGAEEDAGGTVVTGTAIADTSTVVIAPNQEATQPNEFYEGMAAPQTTVEDSLDRVAMAAQTAKLLAQRGIRVPAGEAGMELDAAADRANTTHGYGASGALNLRTDAQLAAAIREELNILAGASNDNGVQTCADATARAALAPEFVGQLLVQRDDGTLWIGESTSAGDWSATMSEKKVFTGGDPTGASSSAQDLQDFLDSYGTDEVSIVFIPGSTYMVNGITVDSNTRLYMYDVAFNYGGSAPSGFAGQDGIFWIEGADGSPKSNIGLYGGTLTGSGDVYPTIDTDDLVQAKYCNDLVIQDMRIYESGQDGIELKSCNRAVIRNNYLQGISDAAIETRGCSDILIENNVAINAKNGFMAKPHEPAGGGDTVDGDRHTIQNNYFKTYSTCILNQWINDSVISYNRLEPVTSGAAITAIDTGEHASVDRLTDELHGLMVVGNQVFGTITNTAIRQNPKTTTTHGTCFYLNNVVHGSCNRGFDLVGEVIVKGNRTAGITAGSDIFALYVIPKGPCVLSGNVLTDETNPGTVYVLGDGVIETDVLIAQNVVRSIKVDLCHAIIDGNTVENQIFVSTTGLTASVTNNLIRRTEVIAGSAIEARTACAVVKGNTIYFDGVDCSFNCINVYADKVRTTDNTIVSSGTPSGSAIIYNSGADRGVISNNVVDWGSSTSSTLLVESDYISVLGNDVTGGNQNIRINGNYCTLLSNYTKDAVFQNIHVNTGATATHVDHCTTEGTGTGLDDDGTSTVTGSNRAL